ncbi:MAG: hypothetical protein ABIP94_13195, partial [Planctomycetota bacterium]
VKAAMQGAGKLVARELKDDPDLKKFGLADGLGKFVTGLLENERNLEMIGDLARRAAESALKEAKFEIRHDSDLKQLGISVDVEGLLDGLFSGNGDFEASLQRIIDKAMKASMNEIREQSGDEGDAKLAPRKQVEQPAKKGRDSKALIR